MSGEAYCPGLELLNFNVLSLDSSSSAESLCLNPLHCLLCQTPLLFPISLSCHHVFCKKCVVNRRDKDTNRLKCPLCSSDCSVSDANLTCDPLIQYLVESTNEKTDVCANCDKINQPMYFCETCHQPLCCRCKDETHQAKMFATHKIVLHEERTGASAVKKCKNHGEPYILFCAENKSLVCINCFRTASMESRPHYVDLDTAYKIGCDKLEKFAKQLKTFQKEVHDGILLRKTMLDEVKKSAANEINQIQLLCQQMIDKMIEIRDQLLQGIAKESSEREEYFRHQLNSLCAVVPTIQMYLLVASIFCSSANKMDFLDLCYVLMHRIQSVINENQSLQPAFTGQIQTNFKAEFARSLEPYLGVKSVLIPTGLHRQLSSTPDGSCGAGNSSNNNNGDVSPASSVNSSQYFRSGSNKPHGSLSARNYSKLRLLVDLAGAFGDEYNKIDVELKELNKRFNALSKNAQEVQRDLTIRRCVIDEKRLSDVLSTSQKLKIDLGAHSTRVDDLQSTFQQIWEEQLDRVRAQQEMYRNHIASVMCLREDLHRMVTACQQLAPFVRSIALAIQQIKPERCNADEPCPMQQICLQINTLEPNSQNRVDAIERQEQQRKQEMERKKVESNQMLAAVKGKLKTPKDSARRKSGQDFSPQSGGGGGSVVKNVERDRNANVDAHQLLLLSPNKGHNRPTAPAPTTSTPNNGGSPRLSKKIFETSSSSLDESFEKVFSVAHSPSSKQQQQQQQLLLLDDKNSCTSSNDSAIDSIVDTDDDDNNFSSKQQPTTTKLERSLTNADDVLVADKPAPLNSSLSLPVLILVPSSTDAPAPKISPKSCLPPSLVASVDSATLEARERVLASLKEKVRRVDDD